MYVIVWIDKYECVIIVEMIVVLRIKYIDSFLGDINSYLGKLIRDIILI